MASFYSGDRIDAVVADIGSASTKIGWAGDDYPRSYFRSNVAVRRDAHQRICDVKYDYFSRPLGADGTDGDWETCNPMDVHGSGLLYDASYNSNTGSSANVKETPDWCDLVTTFLQHAYESSLSGEQLSEHPLLMAERSYTPPATRQMLVECLFEQAHVPAVFLAKDAVLACYGSGRTSATVIDVGYSGTTVTPVYDGYVDPPTIRRNPGASLGATDEVILQHLDKLYHKRKKQKNTYTVMPLYQVLHPTHKLRAPLFHTAARLALARECRDEGAGATMNTSSSTNASNNNASTNTFHAPSKPYELPDGTTLDVPSADRFRAADVVWGSDAASQQVRDTKLADARVRLEASMAWSPLPHTITETTPHLASSHEAVGLVSHRPTPSSARRTSGRAWHAATVPPLHTLLTDDQFTSAPIPQMVCDAAYRCDRDQQAVLLANVVLSGGGACLGPTDQAVPDYLKDGLEAVIHTHTPGWRVKVTTPAMNERAILPWLGGSILGSLGTFHEMYLTKAEYDEWGPALINRKCP